MENRGILSLDISTLQAFWGKSGEKQKNFQYTVDNIPNMVYT